MFLLSSCICARPGFCHAFANRTAIPQYRRTTTKDGPQATSVGIRRSLWPRPFFFHFAVPPIRLTCFNTARSQHDQLREGTTAHTTFASTRNSRGIRGRHEVSVLNMDMMVRGNMLLASRVVLRTARVSVASRTSRHPTSRVFGRLVAAVSG